MSEGSNGGSGVAPVAGEAIARELGPIVGHENVLAGPQPRYGYDATEARGLKGAWMQ